MHIDKFKSDFKRIGGVFATKQLILFRDPLELYSLVENKVVAQFDSLDEALDHIRRYGSGHSEAIVTEDASAARKFQAMVDAACVYVNAPTSFTDGAQFGLGAEIGISTQKLGARGPMGLEEITSYKWLIEGNGQTRP